MSESEGCVCTQVLTISFGDCVGMEGRDGTVQCVGPRFYKLSWPATWHFWM